MSAIKYSIVLYCMGPSIIKRILMHVRDVQLQRLRKKCLFGLPAQYGICSLWYWLTRMLLTDRSCKYQQLVYPLSIPNEPRFPADETRQQDEFEKYAFPRPPPDWGELFHPSTFRVYQGYLSE